MTDAEQYTLARARAREIRAKYGLTTERVMVKALKDICRAEGIPRIDYYDGFKGTGVRGAYFNDAAGCLVMINKKLISRVDPKAFTLAHELKHHLMDEVRAISPCTDQNLRTLAEKTADTFAAELLFPSELIISHMAVRAIGKGECTSEHVVRIKHETKTTLSHTGLAIRITQLGYALPGSLDKVHWENLRDSLYPEYSVFRRRGLKRTFAAVHG